MSEIFRHPDRNHPYALLRRDDEFGIPEYDLVAPASRFFSKDAPLAATVELGVDGQRVIAVPSPAELACRAQTDGESWQILSRRSLARLWAWFLVSEDPQRRLEAREVETLAHQASLARHILDSPRLSRVLIGDEVGLGKTIEAGLVIRELIDRRPGLRVLYLAPARLVGNVHQEFRRLSLHFRKWTAADDSDASLTDDRIIASIHRAAFDTNVKKVVETPPWDLIIVDECHHLSNYDPEGGKPLRQYELVAKLIEKQRSDGRVILMSGTPHQGNRVRFQNLLRLLRQSGERDEHVVGPVIYRTKEDVRGWNGEPLFPLRQVNPPQVIPLTAPYRAWLDAIHEFYVPSATSAIGNRSRRRAAGWRCAQALPWAASSVHAGLGYLVRQAIRVGWTASDPDLSSALECIRPYRLGPDDEPVGSLFVRIRKEAVPGTDPEDLDDVEENGEDPGWLPDPLLLGGLLRQGVALRRQLADAKWEFVYDRVLAPIPAEQVVLFAQPIETVTALARYLEEKTGQRPALIIGGQSDDERTAEVERFWRQQTRFLVSSRAGTEGINLQCARRLVHVDVPWNPMEMEQRVGRVHRFGSRQTIVVDTVVLQDSREGEAYAAARQKLEEITRTLTLAEDRFEELFARVMSLTPPAELQEVIAERALGPLNAADREKIAHLVEDGLNNWQSFHNEFHQQQRAIKALNPGQAAWKDLEEFCIQQAKGKPVQGYATVRFQQKEKRDVVSTLEDVPVLDFPGGIRLAFADVGGRPIIDSGEGPATAAGLNVPVISEALRNAAFPAEACGVASLRWASEYPRPTFTPEGMVCVVVMAQLSVKRDLASGWAEHGNRLYFSILPTVGEAVDVEESQGGLLVRALIHASVRTKADVPAPLLVRVRQLEQSLWQRYRQPTEAERAVGIRHAVLPLMAAFIS